jgi:transglutaminase-like putative cysteine protease
MRRHSVGMVLIVAGIAVAGLVPAAVSPASFPIRARVPMLAGDSAVYHPPFYFPIDIDYSDPERYLQPGAQSTLSAETRAVVDSELATAPAGLRGVAGVFRWMSATFTTTPSGGQDIGKTNINGLIGSRVLTGCHDWALVMTAVLRHRGIPAIMVDTAGIQWAHDYHDGLTLDHRGHVFAEAYVEGRWIGIDCTSGAYAWDYDPLQPALPFTNPGEPVGHYVLFKGVDPAGYGVTDSEHLAARFRAFADAIDEIAIHVPDYEIRHLQDIR